MLDNKNNENEVYICIRSITGHSEQVVGSAFANPFLVAGNKQACSCH